MKIHSCKPWIIFVAALFLPLSLSAQTKAPLRLGYIGSLSSFAANYGQAVLEGAELAVTELKEQQIPVTLAVEDDGSNMKNTVSAYKKLKTSRNVQAVIGGSWWINAIVKIAEADRLPLLSCETLYNEDVVLGSTYFILAGDLREWVRVYEPVIRNLGLKRGAILRYASGFGTTLAKEMAVLFSQPGREFAGAVEYQDITITDAAPLLLKLKQLNPQVVYLDLQPSSAVNIFKKIQELGLSNVVYLRNSSISDMLSQGLVDPKLLPQLFFTQRQGFNPDFAARFRAKYGREPQLEADLGYYAVKLAVQALQTPDPVGALRSNKLRVAEQLFTFNEHNVYAGPPQIVWELKDGKAVRW